MAADRASHLSLVFEDFLPPPLFGDLPTLPDLPDLEDELVDPCSLVPAGRFFGCNSKLETIMTDLTLSKRLAAADEATLSEILREAEVHLTSQQTVALAADQRAMTFTGFLAAASVVLVGGASGFAVGDKPNVALATVCLLVASAFLVSIVMAVWAARPSKFDFAGSSPEDWVEDIEAQKPSNETLAEVCANYAEAISANDNRMKANGRLLRVAIWIAVGALGVGGFGFVLVLALS